MITRSPRWMLIGSAVLTAIGIWMGLTNKSGGWAVASFFGACLLMSAFDLWRKDRRAYPTVMGAGQADELVLQPDRLRLFVIWVGCGGATASGWWFIAISPLVGWLCLIFFGLCFLVIPLGFLSNSMSLRLTRDELTMASPLTRWTARWTDIASFDVMNFGPAGVKEFVGIRYAPSYQGKKIGAKIASAMTGFDGALSDTYGMSAKDLAALLNDWRQRATNGSAV